MKELQVIYDSQIFDFQTFGGISRYFCEIIPRMNITFDITVRYSENIYLKESKLCKHRLPIPQWLFYKYKNNCIGYGLKYVPGIINPANEFKDLLAYLNIK